MWCLYFLRTSSFSPPKRVCVVTHECRVSATPSLSHPRSEVRWAHTFPKLHRPLCSSALRGSLSRFHRLLLRILPRQKLGPWVDKCTCLGAKVLTQLNLRRTERWNGQAGSGKSVAAVNHSHLSTWRGSRGNQRLSIFLSIDKGSAEEGCGGECNTVGRKTSILSLGAKRGSWRFGCCKA